MDHFKMVCNALVTVVFFSTFMPRTTSLRAPVREYAGLVTPEQAVLIDPHEVSKEILLSPSDSNKENSENPMQEEMPTPSALMKKTLTFRPKIYRDDLKNTTKLQNRILELQSRTPFWRKRLENLGLGNHGLYSGIARLGAGGVSLPSLKRQPGMSRRRTASGILPSGITKNNVIHFLRNNRNLTTTTTLQPTTDFLSRWHNSFSRGKPEDGKAQSQTKKHPIDETITNKKIYSQHMTTQSTVSLGNDKFSNNFKSKVNENERTKPAMTSPAGFTSVHDMTSTHFANGTSMSRNKPTVQTESRNKMRRTTISPSRKKSSLPTSSSKELDKSVLHDTEILESIKSIVKSASGDTKDFSSQNFHGNTQPESLDIFTGVKPLYDFRPSYQEPSNSNQSIQKSKERTSVFSLTGSSDAKIHARKPNRPKIIGPNINSGSTIVVSPPPLGHNLALQVGHSQPVITEKPKDSGYKKIRTHEEHTDIVIGRPAALIQPPPITIPTTNIPATLRNAEESPIYISDDSDQQYLTNNHPNIGSQLPPWYTQELGPILDAISKKYDPYELRTTLNSATNLKALVESGKIPEFFKNENLMEYIKRDQLRFQPLASVERLGKPISGNKSELEAEEKESGITGQFVALSGLALLMAFGGYFLFSSSESVSESRGAPDPLLLAVNQAKHGLKLLQQGLDEYETKLIENKDRLNHGTPVHNVFESDQPLHDVTMDLGKIWKNIQEIPNRLLFSEESPFSNAANIIKQQLGDPESFIDSIKNTLMDSLIKNNPLTREPHSLHSLDSSTAENNKWNPLKILPFIELMSSSVSPKNLALDLISKLGLPSESSGKGNYEMRSFGKQWKFFSTLFLPTPANNVSADSEPELMLDDQVGDEKGNKTDNLDMIKGQLDLSQNVSSHDVEDQETEPDNQSKEVLIHRSKKPLLAYKDTKMNKTQAKTEDDEEEQHLKKYKNISNDLKTRRGEYKKKDINDGDKILREEDNISYEDELANANISREEENDSYENNQYPSSKDDASHRYHNKLNQTFIRTQEKENSGFGNEVHAKVPENLTHLGAGGKNTNEKVGSKVVNDTHPTDELVGDSSVRNANVSNSSQNLEIRNDDRNHITEENKENVANLRSNEISTVDVDDLPTIRGENPGNSIIQSHSSPEDYGDFDLIAEPNIKEEFFQSLTEDSGDTELTGDPTIKGEFPLSSIVNYGDSELTDDPNIKGEFPLSSTVNYGDSELTDDPNIKGEFPQSSTEDYGDTELTGDPNRKGEFPQSSTEDYGDTELTDDPNIKGEFPLSSTVNYGDSELTDDPNIKGEFPQSSTEDYGDTELTDDPNIKGEFPQSSTEDYGDTELTNDPNIKREFPQPSTGNYGDTELTDDPNIKGEFPQSSTEDYGDTELTDDPNIKGEFPQSSTVNYGDPELTDESNIKEFPPSSIEDYDDTELIDESNIKEEFTQSLTRNYDDSELTDEPTMNEEILLPSKEDYGDTELTNDPNMKRVFPQPSTGNYGDWELTYELNINEEFPQSSTKDYDDSVPTDESNIKEESTQSSTEDYRDSELSNEPKKIKFIQPSTEDYGDTYLTDDPNINEEFPQHSTRHYGYSKLTDEQNIKKELPRPSNEDYYDSKPIGEQNIKEEFPLPSTEDYTVSELIDELNIKDKLPKPSTDSEPIDESNMKEEFDIKSEELNTDDDTGSSVDQLNYGNEKLRSPSDDIDKVEEDTEGHPTDESENSLTSNDKSSDKVEEDTEGHPTDESENSLTSNDKSSDKVEEDTEGHPTDESENSLTSNDKSSDKVEEDTEGHPTDESENSLTSNDKSSDKVEEDTEGHPTDESENSLTSNDKSSDKVEEDTEGHPTDGSENNLTSNDKSNQVEEYLKGQFSDGQEGSLRPSDNRLNFQAQSKMDENAQTFSKDSRKEIKTQSREGNENATSSTDEAGKTMLKLSENSNKGDQNDMKFILADKPKKGMRKVLENDHNSTKSGLELNDRSTTAGESHWNSKNNSENNFKEKSSNTTGDDVQSKTKLARNYMMISNDETKTGKQGNLDINNNGKSEWEDSPNSEVKISRESGVSEKETDSQPNLNHGKGNGRDGDSSKSDNNNSKHIEMRKNKDKTLKSGERSKDISSHEDYEPKEREFATATLMAKSQKVGLPEEESIAECANEEEKIKEEKTIELSEEKLSSGEDDGTEGTYLNRKEQFSKGYKQTSRLQDMVARYLAQESLPDNKIAL